MADVTISGLNDLTPQGSNLLPISNGSTTGKTTIASLPVSYNSLTDKPVNGAQLFTSSGNFTVPSNITTIKIHAIGGGAGGGYYGITSVNDYPAPNVQGPSFGSASYVSGISLSATGGGLGFNNVNEYNTVAGTFSGTNVLFGRRGTDGVTTGTGAGTGPTGLLLAGFIGPYGGGGNAHSGGTCATHATGGTGGYAYGVINVTPGTVYPVVVGRAGGGRYGTCSGIWFGPPVGGGAGAVYIEW